MQSLLADYQTHRAPAGLSQTEALLRDLKAGHEVTALDALRRYQCFRLAARVGDLRAQGWDIQTETRLVNGKRIAVYTLPQRAKQESWL